MILLGVRLLKQWGCFSSKFQAMTKELPEWTTIT
jgi:hypothetical protein